MAKISLSLRKDAPRKDGSVPVVLNLQRGRKRIRINTGINTLPELWDNKNGAITGRSQAVRDANLILSKAHARLTEILVRERLTSVKLTTAEILSLYNAPGDLSNFADYCEAHLRRLADVHRPETARHHKAALKKLRAYNPALRINEITPEWIQVYAGHLRKRYGNNPGTIRKNLSVIRMHFNAAVREGLASGNPFASFKMPAADPGIIYLEEDELRLLTALYSAATLPDNQQDALRFFLFMVFTGLHISDARALQIEQTARGLIKYIRLKTGSRVEVPISAPASELISHYKAERKRGQLIRYSVSDQAFNRLIKVVCEAVGIDKPISAKAARHTFATLYYKKNRDILALSRLLGHTSTKTTMVYAHINDETTRAGMAAFDDFL